MSLLEIEDPHDHRLALGAERAAARRSTRPACVDAADVHVARRVDALAGEDDHSVALAVALAVRAVRGGSVCVDLTTVADGHRARRTSRGPSPTPGSPRSRASPLTGTPAVLRLLDDRLLYLDRYWREEEQVCADLLTRPAPVAAAADEAVAWSGARPGLPGRGYDEQRAAARIALTQRTTVLTGGPGTGKTTTVAALLALLAEQAERAGGARPRIALAAPTGKAAARLQQAVEEEVAGSPSPTGPGSGRLTAVTLHRLLGPRPDTSARFRHHRENRLPHDVVVVDETSMVSLTMMARLLEAVRPESRLLLVGDPDQLASVEAGAVLADLVEGLGARADQRIAALRTSHRFGESIGALAEAVRAGDADEAVALLEAGGEHVEFVSDRRPGHAPARAAGPARARPGPRRRAGRRRRGAGGARPAAAAVCPPRGTPRRTPLEPAGRALARPRRPASRSGRRGTPAGRCWSPPTTTGSASTTATPASSYAGPTASCVPTSAGSTRRLDLATSRLGQAETMHAMTIHKSQGSQADEVVVLLPAPGVPAAHPRALLHRDHPRPGAGRGGRRDPTTCAPRSTGRALRATGLRQRLAGPEPTVPTP